MPFFKTIFRQDGETTVKGTYLQAFIKNGDHYFVTEINIYQDGKIDCWGLVDLEEFKLKVAKGWVRTKLPEGARVSTMTSSLNFTVTDVRGGIDEAEFIKEVIDEIHMLNGLPTSSMICQAALQTYHQHPNEDYKEKLRLAYENVPAHRRRFLGSMDDKDWEYKKTLGIS